MPIFLLLALIQAGQLLDTRPSVQYASFTTSASAATAAPGGSLSLWLDVTPKPTMHVYGPGAKGYLPIALTVSPYDLATAGRVSYPKPEIVFFPVLNERTPVYSKPFRITLPLTIARDAKPGQLLTISGLVNYQACDDVLCYPPAKAFVSWSIRVS